MQRHKETIYLAYGSNLNLPQMAHRCPTAEVLGPTELKGYDLKFRGGDWSAVATVEPTDNPCMEDSVVPVLLWRIQPRDEEALDFYEGWPRLYRKEPVEVELDGKPVSAMMYIMNDGYDLGKPSGIYLQTIREGYRSAGFDEAVLDNAVAVSISELDRVNTQLCEKLDRNMDNYKAEWKQMSHDELISDALNIALTKMIYEELHERIYSKDVQEYLLRFENPLEVVCDQWEAWQCGDLLEDMGNVLEDMMEKHTAEQGYALDPEYVLEPEPEPQQELEW